MKINRNIAWAESFVNELAAGGVKYVCISPGSRNTPLTWAFANNNKIKKYVLIDERSSAFFAAGLANRTGKAVALVCTSGTAAVEFYPAIVEAYLQRIPLIVCTADRPAELRNTGTNQTINQDNLYKNHIRWFADAGLPDLTVKKITALKNIAIKAVKISCFINRGPVHINFPFRKPFEPDNFTDNINLHIESLLKKTLYQPGKFTVDNNWTNNKSLIKLAHKFSEFRKGLIIVGPENYGDDFHSSVYKLSKILGYPVLADGSSQLRYAKQISSSNSESNNKLICNYEGLFRSQEFIKEYLPEIIIHFGRTPTSKGIEDFYEKHAPLKIIVNPEGDIFDPTRKGNTYTYSPTVFCNSLCKLLRDLKRQNNGWADIFHKADTELEQLKYQIFQAYDPMSEPGIVNEFLKAIPNNSLVMLSNSLPVRDFDFFASRYSKNLTIYHNRGASGIDGIISTALGIASLRKDPVFLITGDIAFYYDINSLFIAHKHSIPLTVILINNNGGGIFNSLPIASYKKFIDEYFITSHNLDFKILTTAFGVTYRYAKNLSKFRELIKKSPSDKKTVVIEIKTDSQKSLALRKKYWTENRLLLKELVKSHLSK
jgi:2-succinyl-5-enolpyruvyl-6-hydroxy-3-cyclohexene-1-carboxylate synthase